MLPKILRQLNAMYRYYERVGDTDMCDNIANKIMLLVFTNYSVEDFLAK